MVFISPCVNSLPFLPFFLAEIDCLERFKALANASFVSPNNFILLSKSRLFNFFHLLGIVLRYYNFSTPQVSCQDIFQKKFPFFLLFLSKCLFFLNNCANMFAKGRLVKYYEYGTKNLRIKNCERCFARRIR